MAIVYSFGNAPNGPYIEHDNLDLTKILHIRSFWQRHLLEPDEMTFYHTFKDLDEDHKPKMRKRYGVNESELSSSWIGYYCESASGLLIPELRGQFLPCIACLHPIPETRAKLNKSSLQSCADPFESHLRVDILVCHLCH